MKKILLIFLLFSLVGLNKGHIYGETKGALIYMDPFVAFVTINDVEYSLYGKYPTDTIVTGVYYEYATLGNSGYFYINHNILCVHLDFIDYLRGRLIYDGPTYQ